MARTLLEKLGYRSERIGLVLNLPPSLATELASVRAGEAPEWLLGFCASAADVGPTADALLTHYRPGLHLWFAYPKLSGALASDLNRDRGWAHLGERDYHPVTQVALDSDWSALRFRARAEIATFTRRFETR
jgi:hypothetical protein